MTDLNYPGVYIEEDASLALSIAAVSTAVPVFAHNKALIKKKKAVRIDSWLEFIKLISTPEAPEPGDPKPEDPKPEGPKPADSKPEDSKSEDPTSDLLYVSLKTYFENGGGYAYVCPTDQLTTQVPGLDDVTLIVAAGQWDDTGKSLQTSVTQLCKDGKGLFALLDGPVGLNTPKADMADYPSLSCAAVYGPWLTANWLSKDAKGIPPSAAVAGAVCTTDRERGVWKAPANIGLKGGVKPKERVSDTVQGDYNKYAKPLNLIRAFQGTDPLIWGARTLATDTDRWQYVPVRRLFNAVEKDIGRAMHTVMFEPNSQPTWEKVRAAIDNYLHAVWRQGGLQGSKPDEAYFVQIGLGLTMTQDEINNGQLIVKIGLAPVRPAEFIILQMTQDLASVPA
ncbi:MULTISPECIES: phage tail sheath C-terminal domain-containing protein [Burkholderiaceae]|uniref:phage tail sheath family protein n=1 Tax=Burkholderiaceae TaxID=119060 RepID=UPI000965DED7|nr:MULTISPECIES: phage tail sheath C-terminal domain-containing protein [Burkholderiaceae]MCG1040907.1 phage tail sheath subtilisin-like domain-containing protein [Mycetohabitans sp. B7]SIT64877.1 hypothetical protein SAMN04487769_0080 [Burkholderia sp. b14]